MSESNANDPIDNPEILPATVPVSSSADSASWSSIVKNAALLLIVVFGVMAAFHFIRILALWGNTEPQPPKVQPLDLKSPASGTI